MSSHSDHPPQPQLSSLGWACTGPGRTVPPPHCVASVSVCMCVWMRHVYILGKCSAFLASYLVVRTGQFVSMNVKLEIMYNITVSTVLVKIKSAR